MAKATPQFELRLARGDDDLKAGQRLRYDVFVDELGASGSLVDHEQRLECDEFDPFFDHLLLFDHAAPNTPCVGAYRVMRDDQAALMGRYYSEDEYDLTALRNSGRKLLELGRSCVHPDYRGGPALAQLWAGLLDYLSEHEIEVMFGVASFHGTDIEALKQPLAHLHHSFLAPEDLRVKVLPEHAQSMDLLPVSEVNERAAMQDMPSLIKAYLRLGGRVGEGAFIDKPFNTTDVCILVDMAEVPEKKRNVYARIGARDPKRESSQAPKA
jgi:putative hemolysin